MGAKDSPPSGRDSGSAAGPLRVLYDGSCPICRREIALYRGLDADATVDWCDVSAAEAALPPGLGRKAAMARFHVQRPDGELLSGARAFVTLWRELPGWRWLARLAAIPGVLPLLELAYRLFLPVRPWLHRMLGVR